MDLNLILDLIVKLTGEVNSIVWGVPMVVAIIGVGIVLSSALLFMPIRRIGHAFKLLWRERKSTESGDISGFRALMVSMSATVGTGNIAGVGTAIALGGPGALFWMWITALVGMATKYSEAVCAVHYRETDASGKHIGGPMYYIKNGLSKKWHWLAFLFALFAAIAAFGIGNMVQSNSVTLALMTAGKNLGVAIDPLWVGGIMAAIVAVVILGGLTQIARFASVLVPFMVVAYVGIGLIILGINYDKIGGALALIVNTAFTGTAATGGFAGAAVWAAVQFGVARGIFSNEAGLGSAPIAHAAAKTNSPVRQGHIAMLGTFIDTLIVCSITGLIIVISGAWESGQTSTALTSLAFGNSFPGADYVVVAASIIFGFTTVLGWSYYGERCWQYLLGYGSGRILAYRLVWIFAIFVGSATLAFGEPAGISFIWLLSDTLNAAMALPNLIALLILTPVIIKLTRKYNQDQKYEQHMREQKRQKRQKRQRG